MQLFDREHVLIETACLLLSSFTCGMFTIAVERKHMRNSYVAAIATFVLGLSFILLEVSEFRGLIADGNGPSRSAFLSSFLRAGRHARHARDDRFSLVAGDDRAGWRHSACDRRWSAA